MIAIATLAALGQAIHDLTVDSLAVIGAGCLVCALLAGAIFLGGHLHDRRHGCKREHGPALTRRERAVLKEMETQGDLGHKQSGSGG